MDIPCYSPCPTCTPFVPGTGSSPADPDYPFINLSSEAPDSDPYIGRRFGPPPGDPGGGPPLGNLYYAIGCLGFCVSAVSQEDADLCAQRQEMECLGTNWPPFPPTVPPVLPPLGPFLPPGFPPAPLYGNVPKSCDFTCPDGQKFTFTVAAGTFVSFNQAAADTAAATYACKKAIELRLCMGSLSPSVQCAATEYSGSLSVSSGLVPVQFSIVGDLPEGLLQTQSVNTLTLFLNGFVSAPGDYTFTVVATDREGHTMQKACALTFFGITTDSSLPQATEEEPYSQAIVTAGTVIDSVTFTLSGVLPSGLTLNSNTGVISGTPDSDTEGEYNFTITAHADGLSCPKEFFMIVEVPVDCPHWDNLLWAGHTPAGSGGSIIFSPDVGEFGAEFLADYSIDNNPASSITLIPAPGQATITYNGSGCDCICRFDIEATDPLAPPQDVISIIIETDLFGEILNINVPGATGITDVPFSLPDTGGLDDTIYVSTFGFLDNSTTGYTTARSLYSSTTLLNAP